MKKAAIFIDKWKRPVFENILKREGYSYSVCPGLTNETLMIKVKAEFVSDLQPFVEEANNEAARRKMSERNARNRPPNPPTCRHEKPMDARCDECGRGRIVS